MANKTKINDQKPSQFGVTWLLGGAYFRVVLIFEGAYFRRNTVTTDLELALSQQAVTSLNIQYSGKSLSTFHLKMVPFWVPDTRKIRQVLTGNKLNQAENRKKNFFLINKQNSLMKWQFKCRDLNSFEFLQSLVVRTDLTQIYVVVVPHAVLIEFRNNKEQLFISDIQCSAKVQTRCTTYVCSNTIYNHL